MRRRNATTDRQREELRLKQDFLAMLTDMGNFPGHFRIAEEAGAPSVADIRKYIYPDWEHTIDRQIRALAKEQGVGVPDFSRLGKNPGLPEETWIPAHAVKFGTDGSVQLLTEGAAQSNPATIGGIKAELRRQAPHIASQYSALWSEFVSDALRRMERTGGRMSDQVFDEMHDYGMEQVEKHGLPQHNRGRRMGRGQAINDDGERFRAPLAYFGAERPRTNPGAQFYKVWFSGPAGETARLIVDTDKYPRGGTSVERYSRLFPHTEGMKMTRFHTGPLHETWQEAFNDR